MFFPRGGSAQVARALARELPSRGWEVTLVSGSLPGRGDAQRFYAGLDVRAVDFAAGDAPMHPSYEDRPGAPDAVFAAVGDADYEAHVAAWATALRDAGAAEADVLHLHHLTPIHEAAERVAPGVPLVTHLHGTELLMLEEIAAGAPPGWAHADKWSQRMRRWVARSQRILVLSEGQAARAVRLLGIDRARCVAAPNGFDPATFAPRALDRGALWRRLLVDEPCGWRPGEPEGSIRYAPEEVAVLARAPVVLAVGRFTAVKRLGLLVRAFARARAAGAGEAGLVLVGGFPGEWEGEHPWEAVRATRAPDVFLAGWHDHDALPEIFGGADAVALASVAGQVGLVLVEGMACGLPVVAVDRDGPAEIVAAGRTGWLVEPDDAAGLAAALAEVVGDHAKRVRRGAAAREDVLRRFSWAALGERLAG